MIFNTPFSKMSTVTPFFGFYFVFCFWHSTFVKKRNLRTIYPWTSVRPIYLGFIIQWTFFSFVADKYKHCGKFFNQLTDCMEQKTHTEMKSYTCQFCKKSFSYSSACKRHERTHTGEKPYTCKHCNKSFRDLSGCMKHERTHTGEKPYTCKHCKKSFSQSSNYRQHERTHPGEKPYLHASIVKSPLTTHHFTSNMNELTQGRSRVHSFNKSQCHFEYSIYDIIQSSDFLSSYLLKP